MKKNLVLIFIGFCLCINPASAQITFEKTFRFSADNSANDVKQTGDGGYILTGTANQLSNTSSDIFLMKTDSIGDTLWTHLYRDTAMLSGNSVAETSDGGYIMVGTKVYFTTGYSNVYLIKTDSAGMFEWSKEIDATNYDYGYGIFQTQDGGYVFSGFESTSSGGSSAHLVKTDSSGIVLWSKTYGLNTSTSYGYALHQTIDGGFILGGTGDAIGADYLLIKTDSSGNMQWQKTFGDADHDENYSVAQTLDGGFILAGTNYDPVTFDYDVNVVKANAAGTMVWTKNYGDNGAGSNQGAYAIVATSDSGFVFAGFSSGFGSNSGSWLTKINAAGNVIWSKATPSNGYDAFYTLQETSDGGFIAAGSKNRNFGISGDIYLVKTDSNGITSCNQNVSLVVTIPTIQEVSHADSASSVQVETNPITTFGRGCTVTDVCTGGPSHSVWPGDCNDDLSTNVNDFLSLGIAYGDTGAVRTGASLNWVAQPGSPWMNSFSSGINHKHADCNGDGKVDSNDVAAIFLNYSLTHPLRIKHQNHHATTNDFVLYPDRSLIRPGDTVTFSIQIGSALAPIDSIYGIAFSISFDQSLTDTNQIHFSYSPTALGTINLNVKSFEKDFYSTGIVDVAVSRIDHNNVSNVFGELGKLTMVASTNIFSIVTLYLDPINVHGITKNETPKIFHETASSVIIDPGLGIQNISGEALISFYPNPAHDRLFLQAKNGLLDRVDVFDVSGRIVYSCMPAVSEINLPLSGIESGIYTLKIATGNRIFHKRVEVIR